MADHDRPRLFSRSKDKLRTVFGRTRNLPPTTNVTQLSTATLNLSISDGQAGGQAAALTPVPVSDITGNSNEIPHTTNPAVPPAATNHSGAEPGVVATGAALRTIPAQPRAASEQLWDEAYDELKTGEQSLVEKYEKIIDFELTAVRAKHTGDAASEAAGKPIMLVTNGISQSTTLRREQMAELVQGRKSRAEARATFKDFFKTSVDVLLRFKDSVAGALAAYPPAGLAFAGLTLLLERLTLSMNASEQNLKGLEHVALRYKWYLGLADLLFESDLTIPRETTLEKVLSELFDRFKSLYKSLLQYQMRSVCKYYKLNRVVTFIQDQFEWNDWEGDVSDIKSSEATLERDIYTYMSQAALGVQRGHLNITQSMFGDITRTKINTLISVFDVAGSNYDSAKARLDRALPGTCTWFTAHSLYREWIKLPRGLLIVSAHPGCGKSVLSRLLVDHELIGILAPEELVLHFFFKDEEPRNQATSALCGILHQLFSKRPDIVPGLRDRIEQRDIGSIRTDLNELWKIFKSATHCVRVVCVLDGLDECEPDSRESLIQLMVDYFKSSPENARFIVTCRPYDDILLGFESIQSGRITFRANDDEISQISQDVDAVIDYKLTTLKQRKWDPPSEAEADALRGALKSFHNRTYLWIRLVFEILDKFPYYGLDNWLTPIHQIPKNVEDAYRVLLRRISAEDRETVHEILAMLVVAHRPLSVVELNIALNTYLEVKTGKRSEPMDARIFGKWLERTCAFLVQEHKGEVSFIHQTVKEYLLESQNNPRCENEVLGKGCISMVSANRILAESCIQYLSSPELVRAWAKLAPALRSLTLLVTEEDTIEVRRIRGDRLGSILTDSYRDFQLLSYATMYWTSHFYRCQTVEVNNNITDDTMHDIRKSLHGKYFALLGDNNFYALRSIFVVRYSYHPKWTEDDRNGTNIYWPKSALYQTTADLVTDVITGVECGHMRMVLRGINKGEPLTAKAYGQQSLVECAYYMSNLNMMRLLLQHKSPATSNTNPPLLHKAVSFGRVEIVQELLANNRTNPNEVDAEGLTALSYTGHSSSSELIRALLAAGCDIHKLSTNGSSVLHDIVERETLQPLALDAVRELVEVHEMDVNLANDVGYTPISLCCSRTMAEYLIGQGADLLAKDNEGTNLLDLVKSYNWERRGAYGAILTTLHGSNPNTPDESEWLPLYRACEFGDNESILTLLKAGADPLLPNPGCSPSSVLQTYLAFMKPDSDTPVVLRTLLSRVDPDPPFHRGCNVDRACHYSVLDLILGRPELGQLGQLRRVAYSAGGQLLPALRLLLQHGADLSTRGIDWSLPLHTFVRNLQTYDYEVPPDCVEIVRLILLNSPAAVNCKDARGSTPFHTLCARVGIAFHNFETLIYLFLLHRADPNVLDRQGNSPFIYAFGSLRERWDDNDMGEYTLRHLISYGADVNFRDRQGRSLLDIICKDEFISIPNLGEDTHHVHYVQNRSTTVNDVKMARLLLESGAKVEVPRGSSLGSARPKSSLWALCNLGSLSERSAALAHLLLTHGADSNERDDSGKTLLNLLISRQLLNFWGTSKTRQDSIAAAITIAVDLVQHGALVTGKDGGDAINTLELRFDDERQRWLPARLGPDNPHYMELVLGHDNPETVYRKIEDFKRELMSAQRFAKFAKFEPSL